MSTGAKMVEVGTEFILAADNSCQWYVIPLSRREDWVAWLDLSDEDERSWTPPDFATMVNGQPSQVAFKSYRML